MEFNLSGWNVVASRKHLFKHKFSVVDYFVEVIEASKHNNKTEKYFLDFIIIIIVALKFATVITKNWLWFTVEKQICSSVTRKFPITVSRIHMIKYLYSFSWMTLFDLESINNKIMCVWLSCWRSTTLNNEMNN